MPEKPTLDYQTPAAKSKMRTLIASLAMVITTTLIFPSVIFAAVDLFVQPVQRHWMNGAAFDVWIGTGVVCNVIGFFVAIVAGILGRTSAWAILILHMLSAFLLPSFGFA